MFVYENLFASRERSSIVVVTSKREENRPEVKQGIISLLLNAKLYTLDTALSTARQLERIPAVKRRHE